MVLGSDVPGLAQRFKRDDGIDLFQTGDVTGTTTMPFRGYVRAPKTLPAGTVWVFEWLVDGVVRGDRQIVAGLDFPITGSPIDVSDLSGDVELLFRLRFNAVSGTVVYEAEMPGVYLDAIGESVDAGPVVLTDALPDPGHLAAHRVGPMRLGLSDIRAGATGVDPNTVWVFLNGVPIILNGASGGNVYLQTPVVLFGNQLRLEWNMATPLGSSTAYELSYYGDTYDGVHFVGSYTFTTRDETVPEVVAAEATGLRVVRVAFSEQMTMSEEDTTASALYVGNYTLEAQGAPAFVPTPISTRIVSSSVVEVTFSAELSPGIAYRIIVGPATDLVGNVLSAPTNQASFNAVYPAQPPGRRFELFDWFPDLNKREDFEGTGDLAKFASCLQEIVVLLLADIDRWTDILDPDLAPEAMLDGMLRDLGNPFAFDLTESDKRRLVQLLVPLYRQKGTNPGIQNALRFFLGVEATIEQYLASGFELGEAELGTTGDLAWELGPGTIAATYSFDIRVEVFLTDEQRRQLRQIVDYMKPAWTHFVTLREPEVPLVVDHLELGLSELDEQFVLH